MRVDGNQSPRAPEGFSLVELMVVVGIIGILSTLALPSFNRFMAKAKQSEGKTNVLQISTLQEIYEGDNGAYAYPNPGSGWGTSLPDLGFSVSGAPRYVYGTFSDPYNYVAGGASNLALGNISPKCPSFDAWWYASAGGGLLSGPAYSIYWTGSFNPAYGYDCSQY